MSRRTKQLFRKWFPYVAVLLIAVLILVGVLLFVKDRRDPAASSHEPETENRSSEPGEDDPTYIEIPSDSTEETEDPYALPTVSALDAASVTALVQDYFIAKLQCDADKLNSIVETDTPYVKSKLNSETQYIDRYDVDEFSTYVLPGIDDTNFVVYVRYDIVFKAIETGAPSLNRFIVCKGQDGRYWLYNKAISAEFSSYLQETENYEKVAELTRDVEAELKANRKKDKDLDELMKILEKGISSGKETETDDAEETTEPES